MSKECEILHSWFNRMKRFNFPFNKENIPFNGIYILFQKGEKAHGTNRIVRIGTHTGTDQLRSRLQQHFIQENKDRSVFRLNIGRALLNKNKDPFLKQWNLDLTTREAKQKHVKHIDFNKQKKTEKKVSKYIQNNFSFVIFKVDHKEKRLELEAKLISTISLCKDCQPSPHWLGLYSPKNKIRESGLWQVNELYKQPLTDKDIKELQQILRIK